MKLERVGENLLPAIAYGDACGLPYEAQFAEEQGSITELPSIIHNSFLEIPPELQGTKGIWSDDTHLSLATAVSLIESNGFNLNDQAQKHVDVLEHVTGADHVPDLIPPIVTTGRSNGFGRATTRSIKRLAEGVDPLEAGEPGGSGDGVLMKMAPLAYWQYIRGLSPQQSNEEIVDFTVMTHNSPEAIVTSLVHRDVLQHLMGVDSDTAARDYAGPKSLLKAVARQAERWEQVYDPDNKTSKVLRRLGGKFIDDRETILNAVEGAKGGGFYAPETLMMAYGSFALESTFPDCVYRAVELGGDADSIGSIVGGMAASYWNKLDFPEDIEEIFAIDRLRRISKKLTRLAVGEGV